MPTRLRTRLRTAGPYCKCGGWWHQPYCPYPPPWWIKRPTMQEEKEGLKEHIEMLKEELKTSEKELKELEKTR